MDLKRDLTDLLREWEYDESDNVRFLVVDDDRELMQIRQPLGIEQYELDGRPDGLCPEGEESLLDVYLKKEKEADLQGVEMVLDDGDFQLLNREGVLYYYRYLALFQVGRYGRVIRDTEHNLGIARMLDRYYCGGGKDEMLQYRPYILRINAIARAMVLLAEDKVQSAARELEEVRAEIEVLSPISTPIFEFEKIRSLQHLSQVLSHIRTGDRDRKGFRQRLIEELSSAVEREDYEQAARLRDKINGLEGTINSNDSDS